MPKEPIYKSPKEEGFKESILDKHLANGFYRIKHLMFTINFMKTDFPDLLLPMFWLRTRVHQIEEGKTAKSIRKACKNFSVTFKQAEINDEINNLYQEYKGSIDFSVSDTCAEYLHETASENPFDSMMVEIRDFTRLIAVGYFDKGTNSLAGILNFYHPDYKKYSLGKFLILKKIDYALENNIPFYYTGYISTFYTKFDYKLYPDLNAIEVYLPIKKEWKPYNQFNKESLEKYFYENLSEL